MVDVLNVVHVELLVVDIVVDGDHLLLYPLVHSRKLIMVRCNGSGACGNCGVTHPLSLAW